MAGRGFFNLPSLFRVSDEQAMWRVKMVDDAQAFAQLVQRWQRPIQSLCARMTGDLHRAEDLAQETFARLFARRKAYEPSGRFSTFIWRIALNLCHDEFRKTSRRRESPLELDDGHQAVDAHIADERPAPDAALVGQERTEMVRRALLQLGEPYRTVVLLRHYEGLKFREIGEVLEIPEGTVKSRMAEAMNQLARILDHSINEEKITCMPRIKTEVLPA